MFEEYLINEGWMKSKTAELYSAWASDIEGFSKTKGRGVKCPKCGKELSHKEIFSNPKRYGEEIASFENTCPKCRAKLLVWND